VSNGSSDFVGGALQANRQGEEVSVFEWDGSGRDDTIRFERAFAGIGSRALLIPRRPEPYKLNGILDVQHQNMTLKLAAGAVLECDVGKLGIDFSQGNFGSAIRIKEKHGFFLIGAGSSSIIRMVHGTQGNAVTFIHSKNGYVGDLLLEGDGSNVAAMQDDSFSTGLMAIAYSPVLSELCKTYASRLNIRGFLHYGVQAYGDMASLQALDCNVTHIGDPRQDLSVGVGVAFSRGTKNCGIRGGKISAIKRHGFFQASAGLPADMISCEGVEFSACGGWAVHFTEEDQWGVVPGNAGTRNFLVDRNTIRSCGGGIRLGTYDGHAAIGPLKDGQVTRNVISGCKQGGILCQSVDVDGKRLERVTIRENTVSDCDGAGLYIGPECRRITVDTTNRFFGNRGGDVINRQQK
jgi:hypothetical protein